MTDEAYERKAKTIPLFTSEEAESEFWLAMTNVTLSNYSIRYLRRKNV